MRYGRARISISMLSFIVICLLIRAEPVAEQGCPAYTVLTACFAVTHGVVKHFITTNTLHASGSDRRWLYLDWKEKAEAQSNTMKKARKGQMNGTAITSVIS